MFWQKLSSEKIKARVFDALSQNVNYRKTPILGVPGTFLDSEVFYDDAPFLENAPFLSTLIANPNHIGCHTLGDTEKYFQGTQKLENEVLKICAEEIFQSEPNQYDGYVSSGGTEANIQALWIYRNYFYKEYNASPSEIGIVFSEDSHYSLFKATDLLGLKNICIDVDQKNREYNLIHLDAKIKDALSRGIKYFIFNLNLSTTMFGSVDDIEKITNYIVCKNLIYKIHVDAAFGGFIYPFTNPDNPFSFKNKHITSFSIDAHKMMQTPYGTGIFLIRKNFINYVCTNEATYVSGKDHTLIGSRSGANAVAVWMVLHNYGSDGWKMKMQNLCDRTTELCDRLKQSGIQFYRNPFVNIVAIKSGQINPSLAQKYFMVHNSENETSKWWKIVMMPHITRGVIDSFIMELNTNIAFKA